MSFDIIETLALYVLYLELYFVWEYTSILFKHLNIQDYNMKKGKLIIRKEN